MPLGAGVDPTNPHHTARIDAYERPRKIIRDWLDRFGIGEDTIGVTEAELIKLLEDVGNIEEDVKDFYWQSSSAECPEDHYPYVQGG